jgi:YfiH family protein
MLIHKTPQFSIFFGDQATGFAPQQFYSAADEASIRNSEQFREASEVLRLNSLSVIKQVHGTAGIIIKTEQDLLARPYSSEGDYLITNLPGVGIAVATADCVPLLLYDAANHAVAAIHAGWRGSVAGIALTALQAMQANFGTQAADLQIIFGPSARSCCYEVSPDFMNSVPDGQAHDALTVRDGKIYFDTVAYNQALLQKAGVPPKAFSLKYACCTICSPEFCSYRRDGAASKRQMTIVTLNQL